MKHREPFKQRYAQAKETLVHQEELKALMRTPVTSKYVTLKVVGVTKSLIFAEHGWENFGQVTKLYNAGAATFIMRKRRELIAA